MGLWATSRHPTAGNLAVVQAPPTPARIGSLPANMSPGWLTAVDSGTAGRPARWNPKHHKGLQDTDQDDRRWSESLARE